MTARANNVQKAALPDTDAEIDQFLADNFDDLAAKLAAGRAQVTRGEATPLEPLDMLLRDARAGR
ncbi:hypothetical protein [Phenylobacterium sp.]|jgi:hypothetical protein|uniref:hypothetical protein n=1 Tax=Phenylobacterium sp. TaxID=1871053 RepID=UPI0037C78C6A